MLHNPVSNQQTSGGQELLNEWRDTQNTTVWIDLFEVASDSEADLLKQYFQLHPLAIQDAQRDRYPPKIESFQDHTFVLLKGLDAETQDIDFGTIQIAIFIGPRFIVTRHTGPSPSIDKLWAQAETDPGLLAKGADALGIRLAGLVVNRYLPILLALEVRLDDLEDEMTARPSDKLLAELVCHKANLKKLRRIVTYHVQLFETMRASIPPGIREDLRHEVNDVYEHLERVMSLAGLYYELASDLMDGYITMASHRLNHIVKILTIVTTVFVPLSFIAGLYGMNFDNMPELHMRNGYFAVLAIMATTAATLLYILYRKGWLRGS
jgi:magnesium transporter